MLRTVLLSIPVASIDMEADSTLQYTDGDLATYPLYDHVLPDCPQSVKHILIHL